MERKYRLKRVEIVVSGENRLRHGRDDLLMNGLNALKSDVVLLADGSITFVDGIIYRIADVFLTVDDVDNASGCRIFVVARHNSKNVAFEIRFAARRL